MYSKLKTKGIHHVCLRVPNLEATKDFYINAFDASVVCEWGRDENNDHAYIMDLGTGDFLEIFGDTTAKWELGCWQHVAVWTDDIDASYERALAAGGKENSRPAASHIPTREGYLVHMKYAFITAPGGEVVELIQDIGPEDN